MSMVATAIHYALKLDQTQKALLLSSVWEMKNVVIICKLVFQSLIYPILIKSILCSCSLASTRIWHILPKLPLCVIVSGSVPFTVLHFDCALYRSWRVPRTWVAYLIRQRSNGDIPCSRSSAFHSCYLCVVYVLKLFLISLYYVYLYFIIHFVFSF